MIFKKYISTGQDDCLKNEFLQIIEQLADKIKRMSGVKNVLAITSAR